MIFNTLWSILLGIIGGIFSSLIVSRLFFIQNAYQEQIVFIEHLFRKIGHITGFLKASKTVFEVEYDQELKMQKEMKEKGFRTEDDYYAAHKDTNWISKEGILAAFKKNIKETTDSINEDIVKSPVKDKQLLVLLRNMLSYAHSVTSEKEYTFSNINNYLRREQELTKEFDDCMGMSRKAIVVLVFKDKMMMVLMAILVVLIAGVVFTNIRGI